MNILRSQKHGYEILSLQQDISIDLDISDLIIQVEQLLKYNIHNIALRFTKNSYLSTRAISPVLRCATLLRDKGSTLVCINPNDEIKDTMQQVGLDLFVRIVETEDELAAET